MYGAGIAEGLFWFIVMCWLMFIWRRGVRWLANMGLVLCLN